MKIVFWSPVHGQTGTTSNILVTSLITGMLFRKSSVLTQTHFNYNNLEAPLVGCNSKNTASAEYFRDVGLDALVRSFKAAKLDKEVLDNCCITLPNTKVSLLPGTSKSNRDSFEYEMSFVLLNLLQAVEELKDIVFIDVCSGDNPLSMQVIADSDLTVVNLSQNMNVVETFLTAYKDKLKSKLFYLFGSYDDKSKYNINNIRRRFRKYITSANSGVIPYNTGYRDAQCDGKVTDFIMDNMACEKGDENEFFIQNAKKSTEKLLKYCGIRFDNEERM
ncbi:MAG TPA: hypothetical protein VN131_04015 [Mobilitalea sp.]|nr:hypothetical protein [Mobilitalea sp.]